MFNKLRYGFMLGTLVVSLFGFFAVQAPQSYAACSTSDTNGQDCVKQAIGAANGSTGAQTITLGAGFGFGSLNQAINTIISIIFLAAGLAAFAYILLGAFNYVTAGDDSAKTTKARTMITNAVIGLILVALVYVIWIVAINLVPGLHDFFNPTNTAAGS